MTKENFLIEYFFKNEGQAFKDIISQCLSGDAVKNHSICFAISERIKDSEENLQAKFNEGFESNGGSYCDE